MKIKGILFDKDGTLFSYSETWDTWCAIALEKLSNGNRTLLEDLAKAVDFDIQSQKLNPKSMVIASTTHEVAECFDSLLLNWSLEAVEEFLNEFLGKSLEGILKGNPSGIPSRVLPSIP